MTSAAIAYDQPFWEHSAVFRQDNSSLNIRNEKDLLAGSALIIFRQRSQLERLWKAARDQARRDVWESLPDDALDEVEERGLEPQDLEFILEKAELRSLEAIAAVRLLGSLGEYKLTAPDIIRGHLLALLKHPSPAVRNAVGEAFQQMSRRDPVASQRLRIAAETESHLAVARTFRSVAELIE